MNRWRIIPKGEGYSCGDRPWWPHICGAIGYAPDGSVQSYCDLIVFKRLYYRIFQIQGPSFEQASNSPVMHRIGNEMRNV